MNDSEWLPKQFIGTDPLERHYDLALVIWSEVFGESVERVSGYKFSKSAIKIGDRTPQRQNSGSIPIRIPQRNAAIRAFMRIRKAVSIELFVGYHGEIYSP